MTNEDNTVELKWALCRESLDGIKVIAVHQSRQRAMIAKIKKEALKEKDVRYYIKKINEVQRMR